MTATLSPAEPVEDGPLAGRQFERMARAIGYLYDHFQEQPDLDTVAAHIHMSPHHLQRQFAQWVGLSPKKLVQYLSVEHAKQVLAQQAGLQEASAAAGLSGTGRLHDLFVQIERMTPGEYQQGGAALTLRHAFAPSPFGELLVAATPRGICHLAFADDRTTALQELRAAFPQAALQAGSHPWLQPVQQVLAQAYTHSQAAARAPRPTAAPIALHLRGTDFQIKVWQALLRIAPGQLCSYSDVAAAVGRADAARAVGTAIGSNPVAWLIPCHRVIRASGVVGQYRWQRHRKLALLGWEMAQADKPVRGQPPA